jgi:hypothetical protein
MNDDIRRRAELLALKLGKFAPGLRRRVGAGINGRLFGPPFLFAICDQGHSAALRRAEHSGDGAN